MKSLKQRITNSGLKRIFIAQKAGINRTELYFIENNLRSTPNYKEKEKKIEKVLERYKA